MSGFNTKERNNNGEYEITFYTENRQDFEKVQDLCRELIGHGKPVSTKGDLISRTKLLISVLAMIGHNKEIVTQDKVLGWVQGVDNCRELIENAPTVSFAINPDYVTELQEHNKELIKQLEEVERPQGEWIDTKGAFHFICNQCGCALWKMKREVFEGDYDYNFCPNCGADMRNPNCVRCDHFGKCEGCEKGEEE